MLTPLLIWIGKAIFFISKTLNLGAGGTWPGEIVLKLDPNILSKIAPKNIILVAGTNGKTTTTLMIKHVLGNNVLTNASWTNLLNGIVSAIITSPPSDYGVFEVDEATLPQILKQVQNDDGKLIIILLNLFRDQLDRYGEVNLIADKWLRALNPTSLKLPGVKDFTETSIIINADDPQLAFLGKNLESKVKYFGLEDENLYLSKMQHATDSTYCPKCSAKLIYEGIFFSHLGIWKCGNCGLSRPKTDLSNWSDWANLKGVYNHYNVLAAVLACKETGMGKEEIEKGLVNFKPAFGRQEEIIVGDKKIKIFLSKNPAGFNESLRTLKEFSGGSKNLLLVLNDRIPDGRDVSWIWDVDFETISQIGQISQIGVSGDRAYEIGLRLKYAGIGDFRVFGDLGEGIKTELEKIKKGETLYILATYSGMLEARKIIGGRKIL